jgi:hypothetical protein
MYCSVVVLWVERPAEEGALGRKNPCRSKPLEGVSATRRLDTNAHGALTSRQASLSQCSSWQGLLLHGSSDQEALGLHTHDYFLDRSRSQLLSRGTTCACEREEWT